MGILIGPWFLLQPLIREEKEKEEKKNNQKNFDIVCNTVSLLEQAHNIETMSRLI